MNPTHRAFFFRAFLGLLALPLLAGALHAHSAPQVGNVGVGLPTGRAGDGLARVGCWTPVAVTLTGNEREGNPQGVYSLAVETTDEEDHPYRASAPVPALGPGEERVVFVYTLTITLHNRFTVLLEADGRKGQVATAVTVNVDPDNVLTLGGPGLGALRKVHEDLDAAATKGNKDKKGPDDPVAPDPAEATGSRRKLALAENLRQLPDRWDGYDAADLVVLGTGNPQFVNDLAADQPRRTALREWVRRGGQLVVSVGQNAQEAARLFQAMPLLDCTVAGDPALDRMTLRTLSADWCGVVNARQALGGDPAKPNSKVKVARLTPGRGVEVRVREGDVPVLVQGPCGLGRVTLVAFDLDTPPFTTWTGQTAFWDKVQGELFPTLRHKAAGAGAANGGKVGGFPGA